METLRALMVILSLLSSLTQVLSSNPDSVLVQDSSDDSDKSDQKSSAPLLSSESRGRSISSDTQSNASLPMNNVQPFISDMRNTWKKVVPYSYVMSMMDRGRDFGAIGTFISQRYNFRKVRPDFVVPDDEMTTKANEEATSRPQNVSVSRESFLDVTGLNRITDTNDGEAGSFSPGGPRYRGDSKNAREEFPDRTNYGYRKGVKRPTVEQVPSDLDADTRGQNGRGTPNYRPASFNPSSSSGYGGRGTSDDRPLSPRPTSTGQRFPSGLQPDTSEQGGRKTSDDRPASFNPPSSDSPSNGKFGPNASSNPQDSEVESSTGDSEEFSDFPKVLPSPPLRECTAKRRMSQDSNHLSGVINDFAFKLIDILKLETNFVISPLSIFIALSMCYLGSDGATRSELENALGLDANTLHGMQFHKGIKDLLYLVLPRSGEYDLQIANGMFLGQNFTTNEEFDRNIQQFYAAELKNLDFENPEQSMPVINAWVSRATKNMITSFTNVPPPALTRLLLINAMYFKGIWKTQFPLNKTYDGWFTNSDGNTKMVRAMPLYEETFPFLKSDEFGHSFIKLPYEGDQVSMIIALPYHKQEKPMPTVSDEILCSVRDAMAHRMMDSVTIPRFRLEYTKSLRQPLKRLGLSTLFNPSTADLSKMREEYDVYVSDVLHKAVIEVNERGTAASASTAVELVPLDLQNTTDFNANHNFAFYVLHEPSGLVLFYGKIYSLGEEDPSRTAESAASPEE